MAPFMDGVQMPQGYRATLRRQFTFYHQGPRKSLYSFDQPQKDERLSQPCSHSVVLNTGSLDWESRTLTTRPELKLMEKSKPDKRLATGKFFSCIHILIFNFSQ